MQTVVVVFLMLAQGKVRSHLCSLCRFCSSSRCMTATDPVASRWLCTRRLYLFGGGPAHMVCAGPQGRGCTCPWLARRAGWPWNAPPVSFCEIELYLSSCCVAVAILLLTTSSAAAGLHAMMTLRAGAHHVTAVERWLYLSLACKESLVANKFPAERYKVVYKRPTDLALIQDVPIVCNLLICNIFDEGWSPISLLSFHAQAWTVQPLAHVFLQCRSDMRRLKKLRGTCSGRPHFLQSPHL